MSEYSYEIFPLEREGIALHLDRFMSEAGGEDRNILLIHGVTYSSNIFDTDYQDYSLARRLVREGYSVWRLDIAGYGSSGQVEDGFLPDTDYAAEDIHAAVKKILQVTGAEKVDLLGWSLGTVMCGKFAAAHPDQVNKLVLYAPILCGIGQFPVEEPFHHNTWQHAAEDFKRKADGSIDEFITDPVVVDIWCSNCWRYDGEFSPNGGRRDACVAPSVRLIEPEKIKAPTLLICGDQDQYVNFDLLGRSLALLPDGSTMEMIEGGSHIVLLEKPCYHAFQDSLVRFLKGDAWGVDKDKETGGGASVKDTLLGNPGKPQGEAGAAMLSRMNQSHGPVTDWGLSFLNPDGAHRLLDIGCGGGAAVAKLAGMIPGARITGVDHSPVSVRQTKGHNADLIAEGRVDVIEASVEELPFDNDTFDRIITVESFYFWPDPGENLKEVRRVLKPGGRFFLIADIYGKAGLDRAVLEDIELFDLFNPSKEEFLILFRNAGFTAVKIHVKEGTDWICVEGIK